MITDLINSCIFADTGIANLVKYFTQSNFAGQAIVVVLVVFSIVAWAVMLGKNFDLDTLKQQNSGVENLIARTPSVVGAASEIKNMHGSYAAIVRESITAWSRFGSNEMNAELLALRMQLVENAIQRTLTRQYIRYEAKMILLGSVIAGAPFLGLLGTVWGVMDCFGSMGESATVTLQQLAPGVSGALLTTVAGLLVAIPSVFGYNFLLTKSKSLVTDLENFASSLADKIELEGRQRILNFACPAPKQAAPQEHRLDPREFMGRPDYSDPDPAPQFSQNPASQLSQNPSATSAHPPLQKPSANFGQPSTSQGFTPPPPSQSKFKISFDDDDSDNRFKD